MLSLLPTDQTGIPHSHRIFRLDFIIVLSKDIPQSHKIIEIGNDFILLEDVAGVTRTTIPAY